MKPLFLPMLFLIIWVGCGGRKTSQVLPEKTLTGTGEEIEDGPEAKQTQKLLVAEKKVSSLDSKDSATINFQEAINSDKPLFYNDAGVGPDVEVDYANIEIIVGTTLSSRLTTIMPNFGLTSGPFNEKECVSQDYSSIIPTYKHIVPLVKDLCGPIKFRTCLRFKFDGGNDIRYAFSPEISVAVPCAEETFAAFDFKLNNNDEYTRDRMVKLDINKSVEVTDVAFFNNNSCEGGNSWIESSTAQVIDWSLEEPLEGTKYVSGRARDYLGRISNCISKSIIHDSVPVSFQLGAIFPDLNIRENSIVPQFSNTNDIAAVSYTWGSSCTNDFSLYSNNLALNMPIQDGQHTLSVKVKDWAGNISDCQSTILNVDRLGFTQK